MDATHHHLRTRKIIQSVGGSISACTFLLPFDGFYVEFVHPYRPLGREN